MLTHQKAPFSSQSTFQFGLGLSLQGDGNTFRFGHGGGNQGFQSLFVMYPATGKGAVVMTNANAGQLLITEIFNSIGAEFGWPARGQTEREAVTLSPGQMEGLVGEYSAPLGPTASSPGVYHVSREGDRLFAEYSYKGSWGWVRQEIHPASAEAFFTTSGMDVVFTRDSSGRAVKLRAGGIEATRAPAQAQMTKSK
jgi:hypothetical protein